MEVNIGISFGTSFTVGAFATDETMHTVKVESDPRNPSTTLRKCIAEGAEKLGFSHPRNMLLQTGTINISAPFVCKHTVAQKSGPRLGLIVTKGFERNLYSAQNPEDVADGIVDGVMVVGIDEEIDATGKEILAPQQEQVGEAVKDLLQRGAEVIVVSLRRAPLNPANEARIRHIVETEYPTHYLGAVPVVLSAEIGADLDDHCRTNAALLNAYCQQRTAKFLYEAEDTVRDLGYTRTLRVVHAEAGVARVCKSIPIKCIDSDQAANHLALAHLGQACGSNGILALDFGASDIRIGLLSNLSPLAKRSLSRGNLPSKKLAAPLVSLGKGGHSVIKVGQGRLDLGPETAVPACYDSGNTQPTLTDACVAVGLFGADQFGGLTRLNRDKAREVIEDAVAGPLAISFETAARLAIEEAVRSTAAAVKELVGTSAREPGNITLVPLGGAAGVFCCDIALEAGIPNLYCPPSEWALGALGCLLAPVAHVHEVCGGKAIHRQPDTSEMDWYNRMVSSLEGAALRDMFGEGLSADELSFDLELEVTSNSHEARIQAPRRLETDADVETLVHSAAGETGPSASIKELTIRVFRLSATAPTSTCRLNLTPSDIDQGENALVGKREVFLRNAFQNVPVYRRELLRRQEEVRGPALLESRGSTVVVPSGGRFVVDEALGGAIAKI